MAPVRPRLDPDVKLQHIQDSQRRYNQKNAAKRLEAARLRMQRHRAAIANSDVITKHKYARKAVEAAENYWYRKDITHFLGKLKAASQDPSDTIEEGGVMYTRSPGAELIFTHDKDEVFKFLAEDVVHKMTI
ncbi:hypothetical protein DFH09DRAFT_1087969 [Mycena vulgaris]|nr:hypothetical protein DFH09DRAFT_1087969 [Mycena vulgaris]